MLGSSRFPADVRAASASDEASTSLQKIVADFRQQGFYRVASYAEALPNLGPTEQVLEELDHELKITGLSTDFHAELADLRKLPGTDAVAAAIDTAMANVNGLRILNIDFNPATVIYTFGFGFDFSPKKIAYNGLALEAFGLEVKHLPDSSSAESGGDGS